MRMQETESPTAVHITTAKTTYLPEACSDEDPRENPEATSAVCSERTITNEILIS